MNINQTLKWATTQLQNICERPQLEAELLLAYHLQKERLYLMTHEKETIEDVEGFEALVRRRAKNEPYEYIVGSASFYDIHLHVEAGVLIPRPETELLIDKVAEIIEREDLTQIAEIGVGSGAISVVLARKFPNLHIIATDICQTPLHVARHNSQTFGVESQIEIRHSNLIDGIDEPLQLVVSNPPYIARDFILESNVVDYEPKEALFGGRIGDEMLKQILLDVKEKRVKYLACEMGYDQKIPIERFVSESIEGVESLTFYQDLAGFDRGFVLVFKSN